MQTIQYWRQNKKWNHLLGKKGTVIASTNNRVSSPKLSSMTPYPFALVDFGDEKRELMGVPQEKISPGDTVKCVFRKSEVPDKSEVIGYTIKIVKA